MSTAKPPSAGSSRRPAKRTRRRSWWPIVIGSAVAILLVGFVVVLRFAGPTSSGAGDQQASGRGVAVGTQAPAASLQATTGRPVSLADLHGSKVVVFFYESGG